MPIRKLTGIPKMNVYVINRKNYLLLLITCYLLFGTTWFNLFEEVISFVIYQNKCREIFYFYFQIASIPNSGYSTHSMLLILF